MQPVCRRCAAVRFYLLHGLERVCEIEISHMGKNNDNPDLVCKNIVVVNAITKADFQQSSGAISLKTLVMLSPKINSVYTEHLFYMSTQFFIEFIKQVGGKIIKCEAC